MGVGGGPGKGSSYSPVPKSRPGIDNLNTQNTAAARSSCCVSTPTTFGRSDLILAMSFDQMHNMVVGPATLVHS